MREYHAEWIDTIAKECNEEWHIYITQPTKQCLYHILGKNNEDIYTGTFHECEQFFYGYKQCKRDLSRN